MMSERLRKLVAKAGGVQSNKCPQCGGRVVLSDEIEFLTIPHRYCIKCKDNDCEAVYAPSVKKAVKLWNEIKPNK